jgi:DNA-binding NtrC family response regulator
MNILLADDEQDIRISLSNFLKKLGHETTAVGDGADALREFHGKQFDVMITDLRMPVLDGLKLLHQIKHVEQSTVEVIIITGHGDIDSAIEALRCGARDYLKKPIDVRELAVILERIEDYKSLRNGYVQLKAEVQERVEREDYFRGETKRLREAYLKEIGLDNICVYSDAMRQVMSLAEKYSRDRMIPVLIEGETGTGKELIARYIHCYSEGKNVTPFVAIDCGAISRNLFEGELFGHEKGAYTGATSTGRMGKLEAANGGTLFLDEIGEMPQGLQVKLLRVLEEHRFYHLGGIREIPVDFRLISATNKELQTEVSDQRFRLDLFYRINVGTILIPPLRERREDILPLAMRFAKRASTRRGKTFLRFTREAEDFLVAYTWPGNVRQLKNCIERILLLTPSGEVNLRDLSFLKSAEPATVSSRFDPDFIGKAGFELPEGGFDLEALHRRIIKQALAKHQGNQTAAARYLGISRRVLQGRLKKLAFS